jgi:hypothetical protein
MCRPVYCTLSRIKDSYVLTSTYMQPTKCFTVLYCVIHRSSVQIDILQQAWPVPPYLVCFVLGRHCNL